MMWRRIGGIKPPRPVACLLPARPIRALLTGAPASVQVRAFTTTVPARATAAVSASSEPAPIYRVVFTGGPCAGKSSAMTAVSQRLQALGFKAYAVPEAASILNLGGVQWGGSEDQIVASQTALIRLQLQLENSFLSIAKSQSRQPSILLYDRGVCDALVYTPKHLIPVIEENEQLNFQLLRDQRYDMVIHLVTAAVGAEKFYTLTNNAARSETPAQAAALDQKMIDQWMGVKNHKIIDNRTDFKGKMDRVVKAISQLVGTPQPHGGRRYFVVKTIPAAALNALFERIIHEEFELEYTYLVPSVLTASATAAAGGDGVIGGVSVPFNQPFEQRLERRSGNSGRSTYLMRSRLRKAGKHIELQRSITASEFNNLMRHSRDPNRLTVRKVRRVFASGDRFIEFDTIIEPATHSELTLLTVEVDELTAPLPPFPKGIEIVKEVTNDWRYESTQMSDPKGAKPTAGMNCEELS